MKKAMFVFFILYLFYFSLFSQSKCITPLNFPFENMFFQRNDTVFSVNIYPSKEKTDSVVYNNFAIKVGNKKWRSTTISDGSYKIVKYKKIKPSKWFKVNNKNLFQADYECVEKRYWKYYLDGNIDIYSRYGSVIYIKRKTPK